MEKVKTCSLKRSFMIAVADKLYLYDTVAATVLAVTETPLSDFEVQIMDGGYVLSGMGARA